MTSYFDKFPNMNMSYELSRDIFYVLNIFQYVSYVFLHATYVWLFPFLTILQYRSVSI